MLFTLANYRELVYLKRFSSWFFISVITASVLPEVWSRSMTAPYADIWFLRADSGLTNFTSYSFVGWKPMLRQCTSCYRESQSIIEFPLPITPRVSTQNSPFPNWAKVLKPFCLNRLQFAWHGHTERSPCAKRCELRKRHISSPFRVIHESNNWAMKFHLPE